MMNHREISDGYLPRSWCPTTVFSRTRDVQFTSVIGLSRLEASLRAINTSHEADRTSGIDVLEHVSATSTTISNTMAILLKHEHRPQYE